MDEIQSSNRWVKMRRSKSFIYIVISSAVFSDAYLYGLIIPVLPFALTDIVHLPKENVQKWIGILLGAYGAGLLLGSPIAGYWADHTQSRRTPYLVGLITLAASTFAFSIGRSTPVLLAGRLVQGLSSAIVHAVGNAILADTVGDAGMGPAMGLVTMAIALGVVLGPFVGGLLYHKVGYLAVFLSAYVVVGIDLLLRLLMLESRQAAAEKPVDAESSDRRCQCLKAPSDGLAYHVPGSRSEAALQHGNVESTPKKTYSTDARLSEYGTFGSTQVLRTAMPGEVSEFHEVCQEEQQVGQTIFEGRYSYCRCRRTSSLSDSLLTVGPTRILKNPVMKRHATLELLATPRMLAAVLGNIMQSVILTGLESVLPLRIKRKFQYNSRDVALLFLILAIPSFAAPAVGRLSDKFGAKIVVSAGFLGLAPLVILLRMVDHHDTGTVVLLCVILFGIGIGIIMLATPVHTEATYAVDEKERAHPGIFGAQRGYAQAFGLMGAAYALGSLVGPLVGGVLVERIGWDNLTLGTGILCALCAAPSLFALGGRPKIIQLGEDDAHEQASSELDAAHE